MWQGAVVSIHLTARKAAPTRQVAEVRAVPGRGLEGDRHFQAPSPDKEITLIEIESIEALNRDCQLQVSSGDARRQIVTRGAPLNHLVGREFQVGEVRLRGIRLCEPCDHLAGLTCAGIKPALVHRGGLRAQILTAGVIRAGDPVREAAG